MNSLKSYIVLIFVSLTLISAAKSGHIEYFTIELDKFLKKNVNNGKVNYKRVLADQMDLQDLVKMIGTVELENADKEEVLPFYINAYNVLIIDNVIANYPISTVMEVEDFFEAKYSVGRKMMTLNELESKYIIESYENEMIHFGLVCAAIGCPELIAEAYTMENLEMLLEQNASNFLNNSNNYKLQGNTVQISSIFDWYENDFNGKSGVVDFINKYANEQFDESATITFINYDWSLNELTESNRSER